MGPIYKVMFNQNSVVFCIKKCRDVYLDLWAELDILYWMYLVLGGQTPIVKSLCIYCDCLNDHVVNCLECYISFVVSYKAV